MPTKIIGKKNQETLNDNLVSQKLCQFGTTVLQNKPSLQEKVLLLQLGQRFVMPQQNVETLFSKPCRTSVTFA